MTETQLGIPVILTALTMALMLALLLALTASTPVQAETQDIGDGFKDHGPAGTANSSRGMACTLDGEGNEVVLIWLFDRRYAYALAMIDADTGEVEEFPRPIDHDCPFSSMLASNGRYYTYFGGHFMEFDPVRREFSFVQEAQERMAMSMTEDDEGGIWAATNPNCTVVRYDPETGDFRDYGSIHQEAWQQFPGTIATDDQGWVYVGNGPAAEQIIILNPDTGQSTPLLTDNDERENGQARVWRYEDGKVYGRTRKGQWYQLYAGEAHKRDSAPEASRKHYISDNFILQHRQLPGGELVKEVDLWDNNSSRLIIENPETGDTREVSFAVSGGGGHPMSLAAAPNGTIIGGTYIPQQVFNYDPRTDETTRHEPFTQWNALDPTDELFYIGGYGYGVMLEWDPTRPWVPTDPKNPESNPRYLVSTTDLESQHINRPTDIMAHRHSPYVIMSGIPSRGYTGGGLTFWNRQTETAEVLTDEDLIADQSTTSMLPLPDGKLLCGTTVTASLGGERKSDVAELYMLNVETKDVEWHAPLLDGVVRYTDMISGSGGNVFGIADRNRFFVFDPDDRSIVHARYLDEEQLGQTVGQQAERVFVKTPDGRIFLLFNRGIALLDQENYGIDIVAESLSRIGTGGAYLDGRIYFGTSSNICSWEVSSSTRR